MTWTARLIETQDRIDEQSPDGSGATQESTTEWKAPVFDEKSFEEAGKPKLNYSQLENGSSEPIQSNTLGNAKAGIVNGLMNDSFSASAGEYMEARIPLGRLFATNPQGETKAWMSTPEWLGMSEDQWNTLEPDQRSVAISKKTKEDITKYYEADPDSVAFIAANLGGSLIDPSTFVPVLGQTKTARAASGSAIAMADAAMYMKTTEGEINPVVLGLAGVLGGGLGALVKPASRESDQIVETFNEVYKLNQTATDNIGDAYNATLKQLGQTNESMAVLAKDAVRAKVGLPMTRIQAQDALRASTTVNRNTIVPKVAQKIFDPISERLKRQSPVLHRMVQNQLRSGMELAHKTMVTVDDFYRSVDKLKRTNYEAWKAIDKAMFNGSDDLSSLVATHMGDKGLKDLTSLRKAYDDLFARQQKVRADIKYKANYFPRYVKDLDALKAEVAKLKGDKGQEAMDAMQQILAKKKADLGRSLSLEEEASLYEKFLTSNPAYAQKMDKPGATKKRMVKDLPDAIREKVYATPAQAAHSSIRQMAMNTTRREMFGTKVISESGDNLTKGIEQFIAQHKSGKTDIDEVKNLLNLLYVEGTKKPPELVKWFKDVGYMATLGNPISAMTQFGDIFISSAKLGAMNTMEGMVKSLTGKGLSPKDFGLMDNVLEELVSTGVSKKALDATLKYSGFTSVDRLGKATLMNGALTKMQKQATTAQGIKQLRARWSEGFGDAWPEVEKALRNKQITDDVKTMVFMDLADIQPITLLEMPEAYLKHPIGRLGYMLHTFTVKFLNLLRRDVIDQIARGNIKQGLVAGTALLSAYMMGNASTQMLKNGLLGRDTDLDAIPADSLLQLVSMNRYQTEQLSKSREPASDWVKSFAPPMPWLNASVHSVMEVGQTGELSKKTMGDMVRSMPLIGPIWYNYGFGGLEKANEKK